VYLGFSGRAVYKYGASDRRYQHLRANNLVMWEAIRRYRKKGFRGLCFGKTEPEHEGLLQFKRGWGAVEETLNYYKYDLKKRAFVNGTSKTSGFHNKVFRAMPPPLLQLAGKLLYPHMG
jgi:lipid II:glycine glycyltransferase (peptidoglycan interpeptide bridge formation enzyme)